MVDKIVRFVGFMLLVIVRVVLRYTGFIVGAFLLLTGFYPISQEINLNSGWLYPVTVSVWLAGLLVRKLSAPKRKRKISKYDTVKNELKYLLHACTLVGLFTTLIIKQLLNQPTVFEPAFKALIYVGLTLFSVIFYSVLIILAFYIVVMVVLKLARVKNIEQVTAVIFFIIITIVIFTGQEEMFVTNTFGWIYKLIMDKYPWIADFLIGSPIVYYVKTVFTGDPDSSHPALFSSMRQVRK